MKGWHLVLLAVIFYAVGAAFPGAFNTVRAKVGF